MDREEWMLDQVREEIEDLQRAYGFEQAEALAFWHLSGAHHLMLDLARADDDKLEPARQREYDAEGLGEMERMGRDMGSSMHYAAEVETRIGQHFEALYRGLGRRVLRRNYPEGWGQGFPVAEEEE
jgi:hypothetical protein